MSSSENPPSCDQDWSEEFTRRLERGRERARAFLRAKSERLAAAERSLLASIAAAYDVVSPGGEQRDATNEDERHDAEAEELQRENDDLRARLEFAMQDLREMKKQATAKPAEGGVSWEGVDWETRKRRLLERLESDFAESDAQQKADRIAMEEVIARTEEALAEKNQEITELQRLLFEQSNNIGEVAIGAGAIAELLEGDELIRHERENLKEMQDSLREQLRQAEIDISVQRATLAREKAELEERLRRFEQDRAHGRDVATSSVEADKSAKPPRSRWLSRLGLGDGNGNTPS